jgi:hypothetical protein
MELDVHPPVAPEEGEALSRALERSGIELDAAPAAYAAPWRLAGLVEATTRDDDDGGYALSPRRTRGATRA